MKTIPANELPELDPRQVRLDALTGGAGRRISVRFGNDLWTLACPAERPQGAPETTLALLLGGEPAELEFSFAPGGKLFERHAEYRNIATMSEPFATAIRATLSREILDALQAALDAPVEISVPHPAKPPLAFTFDIHQQNGEREGRGTLRIGPNAMALVEAAAPSWPARTNPALDGLATPVALCIAALEIPAGEMAAVRPGDCLVLGDAAAWPFPVLLSTGNGTIPAGPAAAPEPPPLQTNTPTAMSTPSNEPTPLADLRLPVLVVAGRKTMTLAEIANLRAGSPIELGNEGEIPVEIEVNNQTIARGRLVRVADKVCAGITEVVPPAQA